MLYATLEPLVEILPIDPNALSKTIKFAFAPILTVTTLEALLFGLLNTAAP